MLRRRRRCGGACCCCCCWSGERVRLPAVVCCCLVMWRAVPLCCWWRHGCGGELPVCGKSKRPMLNHSQKQQQRKERQQRAAAGRDGGVRMHLQPVSVHRCSRRASCWLSATDCCGMPASTPSLGTTILLLLVVHLWLLRRPSSGRRRICCPRGWQVDLQQARHLLQQLPAPRRIRLAWRAHARDQRGQCFSRVHVVRARLAHDGQSLRRQARAGLAAAAR